MDDSQIIDSLGGTGAVAGICEVTDGAVSQWRVNGIPKPRRMYLRLLRPEAFSQIDSPHHEVVGAAKESAA